MYQASEPTEYGKCRTLKSGTYLTPNASLGHPRRHEQGLSRVLALCRRSCADGIGLQNIMR